MTRVSKSQSFGGGPVTAVVRPHRTIDTLKHARKAHDEQNLRSTFFCSVGISVLPLLSVFPWHDGVSAPCRVSCPGIPSVARGTRASSKEREQSSVTIQTHQSRRDSAGANR